MVPYRLSDGIFERCQANAGDFGPVSPDIVSSSNSTHSLMESEPVEYMSEAEMKTYPVTKLTRALCRAVSKTLDTDVTVDGAPYEKTYCILRTGEIVAPLCKIRDGAIRCVTAYFDVDGVFDVKKDIAGNAVYDFRGNFDETAFKSHLAEFVKAAHWCGYNYVYGRGRAGFFQMSFEPLYNETKLTINNKLYHVAPSILDEKILRNGLVPKSKSFLGKMKLDHPDRVYLFTRYDFGMMKSFARQIRDKFVAYDRDSKSRIEINEFSIFEIDRRKMPGHNLYRDSMFDNDDPKSPLAVYTYSNIPPAAMRKFKTFELDLPPIK